ncbi:hypothetical protein NCAS_0B09000 [Naumovozyma castellii]|uniref:Uncharacterized protein n=1 Tax=Naumovozyma castellii TaxID=27288 RepID=G0VAV7_NAUCA|nr:hypothetical protein NCAS_0B09000 [Naumovozyma castellii CBS 4309]CCC68984.1 hypothetical protein NCAS_0B09000 [Naumovozyma castellii CBS 4309]
MAQRLAQSISKKYTDALANGDVQFNQIESKSIRNAENGMQYSVRLSTGLLKKPERGDTPKNKDPLGENEPALTISNDVFGNGDFKLVLNKYPVLPEHSLLVTNEFKHQLSPLSPDELLHSYQLLCKLDNENKRHVIFYNSGPTSGSSLDHKHLQLLQIPEGFTPYQDKLCFGKDHFLPNLKEEPLQDPKLSFAHFVLPLPELETDVTDELLAMCYASLLQRVLTFFQDWEGETLQKGYNVILTKRWISMIPRSSIKAKSLQIGFNATGYFGLILVKYKEVFDNIIDNPQLLDDVLLECGFPNTSGQRPTEYNY